MNEIKDVLTPADGRAVFVFDTETTGLDPLKDKVLSLSGIKGVIWNGRFQEADRIDVFINPERHIPENITKINHIDDARVSGCPTEKEIIPEIRDFISGTEILIGYNVGFDIGFLSEMFHRNLMEIPVENYFDIYPMARRILGSRVPNHKLGTITEYYHAGEGLEFHNSIDDVIATIRVWENLLKEYKKERKDDQDIKKELDSYERFFSARPL